MPYPVKRNASAIIKRTAYFMLFVFMLIFPKAGIKISDIPITIGYCLMGVIFAFRLPSATYKAFLIGISKRRAIAITLLLPFQLYVALILLLLGYEEGGSTIALLTGVMFIPFAFLFVFANDIYEIKTEKLFKFIYVGLLIVSVYGIFLFFYKLLFGEYLEIPFLTVNYSDVGLLDDKYNDRGGIYKLISTYNNGNIFGVSVLMLLPIAQKISCSRSALLVIKVALLLTLSRTVWFGLVVHEILEFISVGRFSIRKILMLISSFSLVVFFVVFFMGHLNWGVGEIFDGGLGGRSEQISSALESALLPDKPYSGIAEMLLMEMINEFGFLGGGLFGLGFLSPIAIFLLMKSGRSVLSSAPLRGMIIYVLVAQIDGAFLLIPVLVIYWFLAALILRKPVKQDVYSFARPVNTILIQGSGVVSREGLIKPISESAFPAQSTRFS